MKKEALIGIIIGSLLILGAGIFIFLNLGSSPPEQNIDDPNQMVDCGKMQSSECFAERMKECMPVTGQLVGPTDESIIEITILGEEDGKCHFERKKDDVLNIDCYFSKENLSWAFVEQAFGIEKGLKSVVEESCTVVNVV